MALLLETGGKAENEAYNGYRPAASHTLNTTAHATRRRSYCIRRCNRRRPRNSPRSLLQLDSTTAATSLRGCSPSPLRIAAGSAIRVGGAHKGGGRHCEPSQRDGAQMWRMGSAGWWECEERVDRERGLVLERFNAGGYKGNGRSCRGRFV